MDDISGQDILGHGNGFLKSDFYYAFENIEEGLFTTRNRLKHAHKRRYVSHMFSPKAMVDFEPYMTDAIMITCRQMNSLIDTGNAGLYRELGKQNPNIRLIQKDDEAAVDVAKWNAYLAYDIISDLTFGSSFGFCSAGLDTNDGIRKLRDSGEWTVTVGQIPWIKPWTAYCYFDYFFVRGLRASQALAKIAIAAVEKRKASVADLDRRDILYWLLKAKNPDTDLPLPRSEVNAEALTQMVAGSDTSANTLNHVMDLMCRHPKKKAALQDELDQAFPSPLEPDFVVPFPHCKDLVYLQAVLYETLRLRSTVSVGLPRVVGKGGASICGQWFEEGTMVSTPTYTIHRDPRIWDEPDEFCPERWIMTAEDGTRKFNWEYEKWFLGFSYGPRACVGRNVAFMELKKTVATMFRRYDYRLVHENEKTLFREGFHLKCPKLELFVSRR
ncbi:hypothetical protein BP6252_06687 [Coleophoma cylindrospora]|uniref:Uncharacterized protein n=1 Tax=Coleophoma cylindrospora TaxID=1849047 RepID=A0A3D8RNG1_9HELO|nr:hypothetical protein BP6252_06687 [Coleophoma cylindrospora]